MEALARDLAVELGPIRANAVSPGLVRTNLWQNVDETQRPVLCRDVGARLPVGRVGEAEDIAEKFHDLRNSGFTTGQTFVVDGETLLVWPTARPRGGIPLVVLSG